MRIKSTLFCFISILASANHVFGTDIFVPTDYQTINAAFNAANDGDHIYVQPGVYYENVFRSITDNDTRSISITGLGGASQTIIDAANSGEVFYFDGNDVSIISLTGLTFRNGLLDEFGSDVSGAGVFVHEAGLVMDSCIITKNYAQSNYSALGAGLFLASGNFADSKIMRTVVTGNYSYSTSNGHSISGIYLTESASSNIILETCLVSGNISYTDCSGCFSGELYSDTATINSCKLDSGQRVKAYQGTHANNNIFCDTVSGPIAGTGNIFECNFTTHDGACCIEGECYEMHQDQCITLMGVFNGQYTACSETTCNPLDDPSGACCISGMCAEMSESNCQAISGTWGGDYLLCSQVNCEPPPPTAACCLGSTCTMIQEETCGEMGGIWWAGSNCKKAKCVPWTGGCCIDGSCLDVTLDECFSASGSYAGDLTSCKNGIECNDACLGDINSDGVVNVTDLLTVISLWGACP